MIQHHFGNADWGFRSKSIGNRYAHADFKCDNPPAY